MRIALIICLACFALVAARPTGDAPPLDKSKIKYRGPNSKPLDFTKTISGKNITNRRSLNRRLLQAPAVGPIGFADGAVMITMKWNPSESGGADLDHLVMDPQGCITSGKKKFTCVDGYGWTTIGGESCPVDVTPYDESTTVYDDPIHDSTSSTSPAGVEEILINDPDTSGSYHHLVYQYGSSTGFVEVESAQVTIWMNNDVGDPTQLDWYTVIDTTHNGVPYDDNDCTGRFWNTFTAVFTVQGADDDTITSMTVTPIMTITTDPTVFTGSSTSYTWETGSRTTAGC